MPLWIPLEQALCSSAFATLISRWSGRTSGSRDAVLGKFRKILPPSVIFTVPCPSPSPTAENTTLLGEAQLRPVLDHLPLLPPQRDHPSVEGDDDYNFGHDHPNDAPQVQQWRIPLAPYVLQASCGVCRGDDGGGPHGCMWSVERWEVSRSPLDEGGMGECHILSSVACGMGKS